MNTLHPQRQHSGIDVSLPRITGRHRHLQPRNCLPTLTRLAPILSCAPISIAHERLFCAHTPAPTPTQYIYAGDLGTPPSKCSSWSQPAVEVELRAQPLGAKTKPQALASIRQHHGDLRENSTSRPDWGLAPGLLNTRRERTNGAEFHASYKCQPRDAEAKTAGVTMCSGCKHNRWVAQLRECRQTPNHADKTAKRKAPRLLNLEN